MYSKKVGILFLIMAWTMLSTPRVSSKTWVQTDWSGGPGQIEWVDTCKFLLGESVDHIIYRQGVPGELKILYWKENGDLYGVHFVYCLLEVSDSSLYAGTGSVGGPGDVFKSTDWGEVWTSSGLWQEDVSNVLTLLEATDGTIYAATWTGWRPVVFKTTDGGVSWTETGVIPEPGERASATALIESFNGSLYVATSEGNVFHSTDQGSNWVEIGDFPGATCITSLIQTSDRTIYAGGAKENTTVGTYLPDYFIEFYTDPYQMLCSPGVGAVFKSTDQGSTWVETDSLPSTSMVWSLIGTCDGTLYCGTTRDNTVFKSTDGGDTWDITILEGTNGVRVLIEDFDSAIYAGTYDGAVVFKTTDGGESWVSLGSVRFAGQFAQSLLLGSNGYIYAGLYAAPNGVYRGGYDQGYIISSIYDTGKNLEYGTMTWDATMNGGEVALKVRTGDNPMMFDATPWENCEPVTNWQDITTLSSVNDGDRFVQYHVEMSTTHLDITPVLHEISIEYNSELLPPESLWVARTGDRSVELEWLPPTHPSYSRIDTLRYDDGTDEYEYAYRWAGSRWAKRFTPPDYPCRILGTMFHFHSYWPNSEHENIGVEIFLEAYPDGPPAIEPVFSDTFPSNWWWTFVDLSPFNLCIDSGDFFIANLQVTDAMHCEAQSVSRPPDPFAQEGRDWIKIQDCSWQVVGKDSMNFMIRALVRTGADTQVAVLSQNLSSAPEKSRQFKRLVDVNSQIISPKDSERAAKVKEIGLSSPSPKSISIRYNVYRRLEGESYDQPINSVPIDTTFYRDDSVSKNITYYYVVTAVYDANESPYSNEVEATPTEVVREHEEKGLENIGYKLMPTYPNPVTSTPTICYSVADFTHIVIKIYDVSGRLVKTLVDEEKIPGNYKITWNCKDNEDKAVKDGVYFCRLICGNISQTRKIALLK